MSITLNKFKAYNKSNEDQLLELCQGNLYLATPQELNDPHEFIFDTNNNCRICSFTNGSNSNLMLWAHYAGSFNGVAVEFSASDIKTAIKEQFTDKGIKCELLDVEYVLENKEITSEDHLKKKLFQWHYESESRIVSSDNPETPFLKVKPIKVMRGYRFVELNPDFDKKLKETCLANKIEVGYANKNMAIYMQDKILDYYIATLQSLKK